MRVFFNNELYCLVSEFSTAVGSFELNYEINGECQKNIVVEPGNVRLEELENEYPNQEYLYKCKSITSQDLRN